MDETLCDGGLWPDLLTGSTTVSPYTHSCPMRWGDMDAQGHINNAAYLDYLQEARVGFLLSGSPVLHQLLDSGVLVVNHQVEYLKPVAFSDRPLIDQPLGGCHRRQPVLHRVRRL